ncbi:MAG: ABC transporter permease [Chloroflexi bacterium]|nr:ABC transporter permease [Chloroflexota bacterium]
MGLYLAIKEIWRNRTRFLLFSLVIALITILVLFIAALAVGLANANKEYLDKLNTDLLAFQDNVDLQITTSQIGWSKLNDIRRVDGVVDIGAIGYSRATLVFEDGREPVDVSLIGVEAGRPGSPSVTDGRALRTTRGNEVVIDENAVRQAGLAIGDQIIIKVIQGTKEEFYALRVVGTAEAQQYLYAPSIFLPFQTWERVRPQAVRGGTPGREQAANMVAIRVQSGLNLQSAASRIQSQVSDLQVVDKETAIQAIPGYSVQQSTLNTQRSFTLLIGLLVIGGFFQIQTLQKVPQIGVLKAIGADNKVIAVSVVSQISIVTLIGVAIGTLVTFLFSIFMPDAVPIIFEPRAIVFQILGLLAIGPLGGLVAVRLATRIEPLTALGVSS